MAFVLATEIQGLAAKYGVERLGFLTLTFKDHVTDIREAQRRFHSLNTHVIKPRYERAIGVWERMGSRRIHFHLVVVLPGDIRTGVNFAELENGVYRSAGALLRSEWAFWRKTAPLYRFGRTELLPVISTAEGIARYVGKYVSKHIGKRLTEDRGARVVRFIGFKAGQRTASVNFTWNSDGSWLWRQKVKKFCTIYGIWSYDNLAKIFGKRWAWLLCESIMSTELGHDVVYPSLSAALWESDARARRGVRGDLDLRESASQSIAELKTKHQRGGAP